MPRSAFGLVLGIVLGLAAPGLAGAAEYTLHPFRDGADGAWPESGVILDPSGVLYGTTQFGGAAGCAARTCGPGTIFRLSPPVPGHPGWVAQVLHQFHGSDGTEPYGGLVEDSAGALYGTTAGGGIATGAAGCGSSGCGVAFRLEPPAVGTNLWTIHVLHRFLGGADGAFPRAGLAADPNGAYFGTTAYGGGSGCGGSGCGTVFKLTPPAPGRTAWTSTVIHRFHSATAGMWPWGGVVLGPDGALYGTTTQGGMACTQYGASGCGTVYRLAPPPAGQTGWTFSLLHQFHGTDGAIPRSALVMDASGALYGTAEFGGRGCDSYECGFGTVFMLAPPSPGGIRWALKVLHFFAVESAGANPQAGLTAAPDGSFYGTTEYGGGHGCGGDAGCGTVFHLVPPAAGETEWTEHTLLRFESDTGKGANPEASGVALGASGALYGTTTGFGQDGNGTVFELVP